VKALCNASTSSTRSVACLCLCFCVCVCGPRDVCIWPVFVSVCVGVLGSMSVSVT
jgi:hypothetical protein